MPCFFLSNLIKSLISPLGSSGEQKCSIPLIIFHLSTTPAMRSIVPPHEPKERVQNREHCGKEQRNNHEKASEIFKKTNQKTWPLPQWEMDKGWRERITNPVTCTSLRETMELWEPRIIRLSADTNINIIRSPAKADIQDCEWKRDKGPKLIQSWVLTRKKLMYPCNWMQNEWNGMLPTLSDLEKCRKSLPFMSS